MTTHQQHTNKIKAKVVVQPKAAPKIEPKPEPQPALKVGQTGGSILTPKPVESRNGTLARCADIARSFVSRGATSHSHSDLVALAIADAIEALKDKS